MLITIISFAILAVFIFAQIGKCLQSTFRHDPAATAYSSEALIEKQSERASRLKEKNERLMDDARAKMDRLKRD